MTERLATNLKRRAAAWAGQLTRLARELAPAHVAPAISSHVEDKGDGSWIIRITADRSIAPDARAQEFGSGIHAKRGPKTTYVIAPKKKKLLAFEWDVLDEVMAIGGYEGVLSEMYYVGKFAGVSSEVGESGNPKYLFRYVDHPGIEAANEGKGYIAPAMAELRARARENLDQDIRDAIVSDLRRAFGEKPR